MVSSYARTKEASQAKYISILNIIQGEVDPTQVILIVSSMELLKISVTMILLKTERNLCCILEKDVNILECSCGYNNQLYL